MSGWLPTRREFVASCVAAALPGCAGADPAPLPPRRRGDLHVHLFGTGDGGLSVEQVAPQLVAAAVDFLRRNPETSLKEVYLLAFSARHSDACQTALRDNAVLEPIV